MHTHEQGRAEGDNLQQISPLSTEADRGLDVTTLSQNQESDASPTEPPRSPRTTRLTELWADLTDAIAITHL